MYSSRKYFDTVQKQCKFLQSDLYAQNAATMLRLYWALDVKNKLVPEDSKIQCTCKNVVPLIFEVLYTCQNQVSTFVHSLAIVETYPSYRSIAHQLLPPSLQCIEKQTEEFDTAMRILISSTQQSQT